MHMYCMNSKALQDCKHFICILKQITEMFSKQLAALIISLMFGGIVHFYKGLSLIFGMEDYLNDWRIIMLIIGDECMGMLFVFALILIVNIVSDLELRIAKLVNAVMDCPASFEEKQKALHYLESFEGFSAMGFFKLRRSLLSSIAVNYITYIIILMQFKINDKVKYCNKSEN
jgi:hypothetical protein